MEMTRDMISLVYEYDEGCDVTLVYEDDKGCSVTLDVGHDFTLVY